MYLVYLGGVVLMLIIKLIWDYKVHKNPNKLVNHKLSVWIDGVVYVALSYFLFDSWTDRLAMVILAIWFRWTFFDAIFNLINGWHIAYCGNTSKVDEVVDEIDGKDDERCVLGFLFKGILLVIGLLILFLF